MNAPQGPREIFDRRESELPGWIASVTLEPGSQTKTLADQYSDSLSSLLSDSELEALFGALQRESVESGSFEAALISSVRSKMVVNLLIAIFQDRDKFKDQAAHFKNYAKTQLAGLFPDDRMAGLLGQVSDSTLGHDDMFWLTAFSKHLASVNAN